LDDLEFRLVCPITLDTDQGGEIVEYCPSSRYKNTGNLPLHEFGKEPFCHFKIPSDPLTKTIGIYALVEVGGQVKYIGETGDSLVDRFNGGYGRISPRNPFKGGQQTNCHINKRLLESAKSGRSIELWFHPTDVPKGERKANEKRLIRSLRPPWNLE